MARFGAGALLAACSGALADPQSTVEQVRLYQQYTEALARDDYRAAAAFARDAHRLNEAAFGAAAPELADTLRMLAGAAEAGGDLERAADHFRQVLELERRRLGERHPDLLPALEDLVRVELARGAHAPAAELLEAIATIEQESYGPRHPDARHTLERLAAFHEQTGDAAAAQAVRRRIRSLETAARDLVLDTPRYEMHEGSATVRVFYGTNRARTGLAKASRLYGSERGELEVGHVDVNIPATHKYGELETESRWSIYTYVLGEEAKRKRYVLLLDVRPLTGDAFSRALDEHIQASPSNDVFLFVHGYNSSFQDAAFRAAQLAYDLDFDGTPVLFSWPSKARTAAYTMDEAAVRVSGKKMADFLDRVLAAKAAKRVHLIGHSMGNRALIEALQTYLIRHGGPAAPVFDQVVFTAPDVDRDYFVDALEPIQRLAGRVTLYASDNDVALLTSQMLHGAPRAGLAGDTIVTRAGLDTIDMSAVEADLLGHNYYAADAGAIYDLFRLLWRGDPPQDRCGMSHGDAQTGAVWTFNVDFCRGGDLLQAGLLMKRFGARARAKVRERIAALASTAQREQQEEWSRILDRLDGLLPRDR